MFPTLRISLLGGFSLEYGGRSVTAVATPRLQSLLAYLLLHRAAPQARQRVAFQLWPESTESQARTNLRRELHALRRALPDVDRFLDSAATLRWRPDSPYTLDVARFEAALEEARRADESGDRDRACQALQRAVAMYGGELLPGCYDDWIVGERERFRRLLTGALDQLIALLEQAHDYAAAARLVEQLLQHEPLSDESCRRSMRLHALAGNRAAALRAYRAHAERLERELDVEPDLATRQFYEQLRSSTTLPERPAPARAEMPLVGRAAEWRLLLAAWQSSARNGHLALIEGEAGIGKSRVAEELRTWASRQGVVTAAARSHAAEGAHAYAPVVDWLRSRPFRRVLPGLNPVWLSELSRLLPELLIERPDIPPPVPAAEGSDRRLWEALAQVFGALGTNVLLVIDDLQWTDRGTVDWLRYLVHHAPPPRLLVVGTVRSEELRDDHPLAALRLDLRRAGLITEVELGPLDHRETNALVSEVAGRVVDDELARWVYRETEGNPLFIVETVRAGLLDSSDASAASTAGLSQLPPKVSAVIAARLAQLSPPARELAALAATVGRQFSLDLLLAAGHDDEEAVVTALDELCARHVLREHGEALYDFSHDKLREVAYAEISTARCRLLHRRVARALESVHARDLDAVSAQLAAHCRQGGLPDDAVRYYELAGQRAHRLCAFQDGIAHIRQGLELLATLPDSPERTGREARLQTALGVALMATIGWPRPEVGVAYRRARALYQHGGDPEELARMFWGLFAHSQVSGDLAGARSVGEQALVLAEERDSLHLRIVAHVATGSSLYHLGALTVAREHLERAVALHEPDHHQAHASLFGPDLGVFSRSYLSHLLWHLGDAEQAIARIQEAEAIAREHAHSYSVAIALDYAAILAQLLGDVALARERAEEAIRVCQKHGFTYYLAWGRIVRGWALAEQGRSANGLVEIQHGLAELQASGTGLRLTYYLTLLARAQLAAGRPEDGLRAVDEAWGCMERSDERCWEPALHRIRGELLLARGAPVSEVEDALQRAISTAQGQQARSLEARAAAVLRHLWQTQGRDLEVRDRLAAVYGAIPGAFRTPQPGRTSPPLDDAGS